MASSLEVMEEGVLDIGAMATNDNSVKNWEKTYRWHDFLYTPLVGKLIGGS
jgi:hypothetical protein